MQEQLGASASFQIWVVIVFAAIIIVCGAFTIGFAARKQKKVNIELLTWGPENGVQITFGAPPPGSNQNPNELVHTFKNSPNPFFHPAYDKASDLQTLYYKIVDGRDIWMLLGYRFLGNTSYPESVMICRLKLAFPTGVITDSGKWTRAMLPDGYVVVEHGFNSRNVKSPNPEAFKPLLDTPFCDFLTSSKVMSCDIRGEYMELRFDGESSSAQWDAHVPDVLMIAKALEDTTPWWEKITSSQEH